MLETQYADTIAQMLADPDTWIKYAPPAISALIRVQVAAEQMITLVRGCPQEYLATVRDSDTYRREFAAAQTAHAEFKGLSHCRN